MDYDGWMEIWGYIVEWVGQVRGRPNLPATAWPLIYKLYDLINKLRDAIETGNHKKASSLRRVIDIYMLTLWQLLNKG